MAIDKMEQPKSRAQDPTTGISVRILMVLSFHRVRGVTMSKIRTGSQGIYRIARCRRFVKKLTSS